MSTATGERTADERRELLASAVRKHVRSGYRVESQTDFQAVVVKGRRPNHLLHLILSIITIGIWFLFVWLPLMIFGGEKRRVLTVDTSGKINRARGRG